MNTIDHCHDCCRTGQIMISGCWYRVEFENSYEATGPFGAKSIGEVVINTPLPAISDAIYNAIGTRFYELPITPEQIAMAAAENHK